MKYILLAKYDEFVIKLDGLAGGKGVYVQGDHFENKREGIDIIRVHDVREHVDLFSVLERLEE